MSRPRPFLRLLRVLLTLGVAAGVVWTVWERLRPKLESLPPAAVQPKPFDPAFHRLTPREIAMLPLAVRFDFPMGSEHGALTYNAQPFRITRHLGDDLNGIGGENSDLGDPVHAAGAGRVVYCGVPGPGWGNMVILAHRVPENGELAIYQTVYAHLDQIQVRPDQRVVRGEQIGTVGTANGAYLAHLHFEVRQGPFVNPGAGYADTPLNRVSPERFLVEHCGADAALLNPPPAPDLAEMEIQHVPGDKDRGNAHAAPR